MLNCWIMIGMRGHCGEWTLEQTYGVERPCLGMKKIKNWHPDKNLSKGVRMKLGHKVDEMATVVFF